MFFRKSTISVVLVEDERLSAEFTADSLSRLPRCLLLGIAHNVASARPLIAELRPRVVLMDWKLPDGDGIALIGDLAHLYPDTRWLVYSAYQCHELMEAADSVGAHGVVDKSSAARDDILRAIIQLDEGGDYYCPASRRLMHEILSMPEGRQLTAAQREILKRLSRAQSRPEIAAALGVSQGALTTQIVRIARKLGFGEPPSMSMLVARAREVRELPKNPSP